MTNRVSVFLHFWVHGIVFLSLYHQPLVLVLVQELVGCFFAIILSCRVPAFWM